MRDRIKRVGIISAVVLLFGCAYAVLYTVTGIGIPCLFHLITGLKCPGCGVTRMLVSLIQLDFAAAFYHNAVLFCMLPFLLTFFLYWIYRYIRYGIRSNSVFMNVTCWIFVATLLIWGIIRNLIGM